jgi:pimeloyl-ACP methyl ester carboxylesterase
MAMGEFQDGYVDANGVNYYYQLRGSGEPLLVLHGGLGQIEMFGPVLTALEEARQVIAVDLHGHGRTSLGNRHIKYADIAEDLAIVLKELGFGQVDVFGYSMGGGIALRFGIQHPEMVRRLVIASAGFARDGFYPEMLPQQAAVGAAMADMMKDTPMYQSYMAVAPDPAEFPRLLDEMGAVMRTDFDRSEEVKTLRMPVMLVFADSDMFRLEHAVAFYHLLGGGLKDAGWQREHMSQNRLAIIPDQTHYDLFVSPRLTDAILPFLNGESMASSWAEQVAGAAD